MRKAKLIPKNRILSVTIKRMPDDSPDTSWLGEYSNRAESEYAIDRRHSEDCAEVSLAAKQAKETLEHAQQTVGDLHNAVLAQYNGTLANEKLDTERDALGEAYDLLGNLAEGVTECDCGESGRFIASNEYAFFNPCWENYEGLPDDEIRKYCRQDYDRMESLNRGSWYFLGIRADAQVLVSGNVVQSVTSGGVWGYESDMDRGDFESVEAEQLSELRAQLRALGFSTRAISKAFKSITREEN